MSTDSSRIDDKPLIEADLGDNGGHVVFHSLEEAKEWVDREIEIWSGVQNPFIHRPVAPWIFETQLRLPYAIRKRLEKAAVAQGNERVAALEPIKDQFERYANFRSLYSESPIGVEILAMLRNEQPFLGMGALASNLGIPANDLRRDWGSKENELSVILSGYTLGQTPNVVRRSELPEHRYRMEEQLEQLNATVRQAKHVQDELQGTATSTIEESSRILAQEGADWATFTMSTRNEWEALRRTFESQLRLEAPATYWGERAHITSVAARGWLFAFTAMASAIIGVVVVLGPEFLQHVSASSSTGPFTTLAFLSIPALTALWVLKHFARLFVTNMERSADAKLRETMATTFLALTKEGAATVDQHERLLILEALFRPPAPVSADDSHWGGLSELLTRRGSQT